MGSQALVVRADANAAIGTGHVMRCLALAQAWQDAGGEAKFLSSSMPPLLAAGLSFEGVAVTPLTVAPGSDADAEATVAVARSSGSQWIVVDGYQFSAAFQQRIKAAGFNLLFVDDWGHCDWYCADLVLNQNVYAQEELYSRRESYTRVLLGTSYALLRREFAAFQSFRRKTPEIARKLLITLGGADPDNVTAKILEAVLALRQAELGIRVVVGPANKAGQLRAAPGAEFITGANMPEQMAWADMAVSGAGTTCWELLFMQVPAALLIMAENQRPVAEELERRALASNLGWSREVSSERITSAVGQLLISTKKRKEMSERGKELVDGEGAARVVRVIAQLTGSVIASAGPDRR